MNDNRLEYREDLKMSKGQKIATILITALLLLGFGMVGQDERNEELREHGVIVDVI